MMDALGELLFGTGPIRAVQDFFGPGIPLPFLIVSLLGDTWGIIFAVGLAFWVVGRRTGYAVAGIAVLAAASWLVLSGLFGVPRPGGPEIVVYERIRAGAFPSGHVCHAVSVWGLLYVLGHAPLLAPALIVLLVSVGRLYLGAHYLADLLGGLILGLLIVWMYGRLWPKAWPWLSARRWPFYLGLAFAGLAVGVVWLLALGDQLRRLEVAGMTIGAAVGLPLERRHGGHRAAPAAGTERTARVVIGGLGIAVLAIASRGLSPDAPWPSVLAGLGVVWAILGAPALFRRVGLSRR